MEQVDWQINKSTLECNKYILDNEVDCDVTFKIGEEQQVIKAHKLILRIRSPVFDRMLNGSFCESETDPAIPDVSPAVFRTLLRYCYYDCLHIEGDVASSVLYAATKYMLPILERAARKTLIKKLDDSKIWDVFKYSTDVGDKELYAGCITYLKGNLSSSNILDVIKYADTTKDKELHVCCKTHLPCCLSASNIWDIYKYALDKGDTEVNQFCKEFFEGDILTVREALQSEEFLKTPPEILPDMLHINDRVNEAAGFRYTPGISISEIELFKLCNAWADAETLRQKIEPTGSNKRRVLGECLSLIRFPTMLQKDLVKVVYPTCILTPVEIVNLCQYIHRDPGSECQADFPSMERQFVVTPSGASLGGTISTVYVESEVRVMLSRLWTWRSGNHTVTVKNEQSKRLWSTVLNAKHENYLAGDTDYILHHLDIEPQMIEPSTRYSITAEHTIHGTLKRRQSNVNYISIGLEMEPYKEVKVRRDGYTSCNIHCVTLSLV